MATNVHLNDGNVSFRNHLQTCRLHDEVGLDICSGRLKRGGTCFKKAIGPLVPGAMPTCKLHRDQFKASGPCRAPLPCGFECGRLCNWKVQEFQICSNQHGSLMTCYFLKIPIEMRLRIYGYILPDRPIPAQWYNIRDITSDYRPVGAAILRVNYQIHDEAAGVLYSTRAFTIALTAGGLSMCNSIKNPGYSYGIPGSRNHALQDYQMQLMLLEQQNKKRLMLARDQTQATVNGTSNSEANPAIEGSRIDIRSPPPSSYGPVEPIWIPSLSERYFNTIQHFRVEITPPFPDRSIPPRVNGPAQTELAKQKALQSILYAACDHIHRLIGRLRLIQRPVSRLEIVIRFGCTTMNQEEVVSAALLLLRPFQRLRRIANPEVVAISLNDNKGRELDLTASAWTSSASERGLTNYLACWSKDVSSSEPSPEYSPVFAAYWRLEMLLGSIRNHYRRGDPNFERFSDFLHVARIAREAEDVVSFREVWDQFITMWFDFLNHQQEFQSNVANSINTIYGIVNEDPQPFDKGILGRGSRDGCVKDWK